MWTDTVTADALTRRLEGPALAVSVETLARLWRWVEVTVLVERPKGLDLGPSAAGRLRGALGWALKDLSAAKDAKAPSVTAFDLLFADDGPCIGPGPRPRPYALAVEPTREGRAFLASIRLFGMATAWRDKVADALTYALETLGLTLTSESRVRVRPAILERRVSVRDGLSGWPPCPDRVRLHFRTPFVLRRETAMVMEARSLLPSLFARVKDLAPWQDATLKMDAQALAGAVKRIGEEASTLRPVAWNRWSSRQTRRALPMNGLIGTVELYGDLTDFAPYLAIGETCHAGGRTAFGMGRYDIIGWD